ncbi:hypothetical protein MKW98_022401 [Papaver atlanticum]|uniref:Uncharacterized protein n=1 Tax=Papaver atlanticum TaxID=357466 RepID=A0AAD4XFA8_9MAGN|nr:hypothetical protein MKW98_022401 [Papaver atlanticum]
MMESQSFRQLLRIGRSFAELDSSELPKLPSPNSCIFKVPQKFRVQDEAAYKPEIIAIGPYNHIDKENPHSMEDHKTPFLHRQPSYTLPDLIKAVQEVKAQAIECYHDIRRDEVCDDDFVKMMILDDDFVEMMILDGCFILELLMRNADEVARADKNDPIFSSAWIRSSLQHDLILLENQIPYVVLLKLYSLTLEETRKAQASDELNKLVIRFFKSMLPHVRETRPGQAVSTASQGSQTDSSAQPRHILDLLRMNLLPKTTQREKAGNSPSWEFTSCITDLKEGGVYLKRGEVSDGLLDIQFNNGNLEIPSFYIDENTYVLLRNMIAFEQCDGKSTQITSYVLLLDNLINSETDVKILCNEGIINNVLGKNKELAQKISGMCKGVSISNFCYDGLCRECNLYVRKFWPRKKAILAGIVAGIVAWFYY